MEHWDTHFQMKTTGIGFNGDFIIIIKTTYHEIIGYHLATTYIKHT